jgi:hypothetical protein
MNEHTNRKIALVLTGLNAGALVLYLLSENIEYNKWVIRLLALISLAIASGLAALLRKGRGTSFAVNIQMTLFSSIVVFIFMHLVYLAIPNLFPLHIRNLLGVQSLAEARRNLVEVLPHSPYAKLRPDIIVRVPGDYGPNTDFVYEWTTDAKGFKNAQEMALLKQVPIVAVGDSFVEGLGVHTEQTWASLLTAAGYPTYSLGVQGYAPTQMLGAFLHYGSPLRPKWVLIGYLDGVYERERHFIKDDVNELPSAIGRLVKADREVKRQYRYVITAFIVAGKNYFLQLVSAYEYEKKYGEDPRFMSESKLKADEQIRLGPMQRYRQEFRNFLVNDRPDRLAATREWQSMQRSFSEINTAAKKIGAQTAVIMFYNRPFTYFERATRKKLNPQVTAFVERDLLKQFCRTAGIDFIDTWKPFTDYISNITEDTPLSEYPYLRYDGHPNKRGNELIRDLLMDFFRQRSIATMISARTAL